MSTPFATAAEPTGEPSPRTERHPGSFVAYVAATASVGIGLGIAELVVHAYGVGEVQMVFLLSVLVPATRFGVWPASYAAFLAFVTCNFFFIEPRFTLTVSRPEELLALLVFLVVAIVTAVLAGKARDRESFAADQARRLRRLYEFTGKLSSIGGRIPVADAVAAEIDAIIGLPAIVLIEREGRLEIAAAWPPEDRLDDDALNAAGWAFACREAAGSGTAIHPEAGWYFMPMPIGRRMIGVLGVAGPAPDTETVALLNALAEQSATAIERASLAEAIEAARASAETERVRNVLLASVSHDFRTPLASILGAATSLSEFGGRFTPERRADLLASIREEAERLDAMVRNLLAITRLEAGALDVRRDWVDVGDIVERVADLARRRGARQTITVELADERPLVRADAILIEQALANILGNAVLHCPAETHVALGLDTTAKDVEITVTDDGPGVPAEILPTVFDKFVRGDRRQGDGGIGHGLGLAIARGIAEAHGGAIRVESPVAGGRGSRFVMTLPREGEAG